MNYLAEPMPKPLCSPSLILVSSALTAEERTELSLVVEPTNPDVSLEGVGHVVAVLGAAMQALDSSLKDKAGVLSALLATVERVSKFLLDPGPIVGLVVQARAQKSFWSILLQLDHVKADPRLLRRIGALYVQSATSFAAPQQPELRSVQAVIETTGTPRAAAALIAMEQCTQTAWAKAVAKLTKRANSHLSASSSSNERRIEDRLIGARSFTSPAKVVGLGDALTGDEVVTAAGFTRRGAEGGSTLAYLIGLAHWIGVWLWELMNVEVFAPSGSGLIRISDDCTYVTIDLAGVFYDLAKGREGDFKIGTTSLIILLPKWIGNWLQAMRVVMPQARTMTELTGLRPPRTRLGIPGVPKEHEQRLGVRRFIDARAQPLIREVNQHVLAIALLDFKRAEKSAFPYHAVPQDEVDKVQTRRAEILAWGPLCEIPDRPTRHIGSQNTPLRESVLGLIEHRRRARQSALYGPNAGWDILVTFHNQFMRYVLLMCTLAWLLRGRLRHTLPAGLVRFFRATDFRDKKVPTAKCAPAPLVCGSLMRLQMQFVSAHYRSLSARVDRLSKSRPELLSLKGALEQLADGDSDLALLQLIEAHSLRPAGAHDIFAGLTTRWRADALRHFGTDAHRELGSPAELIELLLRHPGNGFDLLSTACGVSMKEWSIDAANAQDRLLRSLRADPLPGLVSKLQNRGHG